MTSLTMKKQESCEVGKSTHIKVQDPLVEQQIPGEREEEDIAGPALDISGMNRIQSRTSDVGHLLILPVEEDREVPPIVNQNLARMESRIWRLWSRAYVMEMVQKLHNGAPPRRLRNRVVVVSSTTLEEHSPSVPETKK